MITEKHLKIQIKEHSSSTLYSSHFEEGDYIPYFVVSNDHGILDMQKHAGSSVLLIFMSQQLRPEEIDECLNRQTEHKAFYLSEQPDAHADKRVFHDAHLYRLFMSGSSRYGLYLCSKNLKILKVATGNDLTDLLANIGNCKIADAPLLPPVLIVPDVVTEGLAQRLIAYMDDNKSAVTTNSGSSKSRSHIHPSKELELELDDKLSKSLLPEVEKVFLSEISHRETYKVCCYDASENGIFGKHRDTIHPHLHRRYALTLTLNDDYVGGGISFPEYNEEVIALPRYSALVFPGTLYHQVKPIGQGKRFVIVSFLFTEAEALQKSDSERYRFLVQRNVCNLSLNRLLPEGGTTST